MVGVWKRRLFGMFNMKDKRITPQKYQILKALFEESLIENYNNAHLARCVGTLMSRGNHWPVIGITEDALRLIKSEKFELPKGMIQRGHLIPRSETINLLFRNRKTFVSIDDFENIYTFYDKTVLMTREQNKSSKHTPEFIKFKSPNPEIFKTSYIGYKYEEEEKLFLKDLYKQFYSRPSKLHSIRDIYPKGLNSHLR